MVEKLEKIEFTKEDLKNLKFIEPYWINNLNKSIKKLIDWRKRFPDLNTVDLPLLTEETDYNEFAKKINQYKVFIDKKYTTITSNKNVYIKFSKKFGSFINVYSHLMFFKIISSFYKKLNTTEIQSKVKYTIGEINSIIQPKFNSIILDYKKILHDDEYLDILTSNITILDNQIFDPQLIFSKLSLYCNKLVKKKKLSESSVLPININSFELSSLINGLGKASYNFLISLNT